MLTTNLMVKNLAPVDAWKDIVRIKVGYRVDVNGNHIRRGTMCRLTVNNKSRWVIVRGRHPNTAVINMDLSTRIALGLKLSTVYPFMLEPLYWPQRLWFPWRASDPIYRVPAQLALISFILGSALGLLGLVVGLIPFATAVYEGILHGMRYFFPT